jgi:hypothetical protein
MMISWAIFMIANLTSFFLTKLFLLQFIIVLNKKLFSISIQLGYMIK